MGKRETAVRELLAQRPPREGPSVRVLTRQASTRFRLPFVAFLVAHVSLVAMVWAMMAEHIQSPAKVLLILAAAPLPISLALLVYWRRGVADIDTILSLGIEVEATVGTLETFEPTHPAAAAADVALRAAAISQSTHFAGSLEPAQPVYLHFRLPEGPAVGKVRWRGSSPVGKSDTVPILWCPELERERFVALFPGEGGALVGTFQVGVD